MKSTLRPLQRVLLSPNADLQAKLAWCVAAAGPHPAAAHPCVLCLVEVTTSMPSFVKRLRSCTQYSRHEYVLNHSWQCSRLLDLWPHWAGLTTMQWMPTQPVRLL
jgi:hypothetical protein